MHRPSVKGQDTPPASPVIFGCAIEPQRAWVNAASLLYASLRRNGGPWKQSRFLLLVASDSPVPRATYTRHDLTIKFFRRFRATPYLNKTALLTTELPGGSFIFVLDHDLIIRNLSGLSAFLTGEIRARRNFKYGLTTMIDPKYAQPLQRLVGKPWAQTKYFNSGVVLVPVAYRKALARHWRACGNILSRLYPSLSLAEQVGFAAGLARSGLPWKDFPRRFNLTNWSTLLPTAAIIHYNDHDRLNVNVKATLLQSFVDFRRFLETTDNRFWKFYKDDVVVLLDQSLQEIADAIWRLIQRHAPGTGRRNP